jgi:hypothetical protein
MADRLLTGRTRPSATVAEARAKTAVTALAEARAAEPVLREELRDCEAAVERAEKDAEKAAAAVARMDSAGAVTRELQEGQEVRARLLALHAKLRALQRAGGVDLQHEPAVSAFLLENELGDVRRLDGHPAAENVRNAIVKLRGDPDAPAPL